MIGGETTSAPPATISGKAKKNGLATPPVSATSRVATRDRDRAFDHELGRAQDVGREQVVDDDHEHPAERQQHQDRRLVGRPQAGGGDDGRRAEQEEPGHDPDDPVVSVGGDPVFVRGARHPADDRGLGRLALGQVGRLRRAAETTRPAEHRRDDDHRHQNQVCRDRRDDQDQDRLNRHACSRPLPARGLAAA